VIKIHQSDKHCCHEIALKNQHVNMRAPGGITATVLITLLLPSSCTSVRHSSATAGQQLVDKVEQQLSNNTGGLYRLV